MTETKILIVEDELLIAKSLSKKLDKLGYTVIDIVSSGEAVLQKLTEIIPDLILMDLAIKGDLDGIETAEQLREIYDIPVIYVTAYADDKTLERAEVTGSYGYIIKPYKDRELHATIKMAINKHKKIRESLAAAQAVSEDKSKYLAIASHDLRAPLAAIQMSAEMLQRSSEKWSEERRQKHFQRIQASVKNMSGLLEDVLTISQAESGKLTFEPGPLDAIAFCRQMIEEFQGVTSDTHTLTFSSQGDTSPVNLDEKLLRPILANLLSNAIKYSSEGGTISLSVICELQQITFRIRDRGIGMPPEYQAKLFQRFERASNVGNIKGTGLGLSIVKQAVDLHGGQITVESQQGSGTTFTVTLPLEP